MHLMMWRYSAPDETKRLCSRLQGSAGAEQEQQLAAEAVAAREAAAAEHLRAVQLQRLAPPDAARHFRPAVGEGLAPQVWAHCAPLPGARACLAASHALLTAPRHFCCCSAVE